MSIFFAAPSVHLLSPAYPIITIAIWQNHRQHTYQLSASYRLVGIAIFSLISFTYQTKIDACLVGMILSYSGAIGDTIATISLDSTIST